MSFEFADSTGVQGRYKLALEAKVSLYNHDTVLESPV